MFQASCEGFVNVDKRSWIAGRERGPKEGNVWLMDDAYHIWIEKAISERSFVNNSSAKRCKAAVHVNQWLEFMKQGMHAWFFVCDPSAKCHKVAYTPISGNGSGKDRHIPHNWIFVCESFIPGQIVVKRWSPPAHQSMTGMHEIGYVHNASLKPPSVSSPSAKHLEAAYTSLHVN